MYALIYGVETFLVFLVRRSDKTKRAPSARAAIQIPQTPEGEGGHPKNCFYWGGGGHGKNLMTGGACNFLMTV